MGDRNMMFNSRAYAPFSTPTYTAGHARQGKRYTLFVEGAGMKWTTEMNEFFIMHRTTNVQNWRPNTKSIYGQKLFERF